MPRKPRLHVPGGFYHVILRGNHREPLFGADRDQAYLNALVGDVVDNVPGVEKVGPKTAAKWIAEHGSLQGVIAAADSIKGTAGENLRRALDWLPQAQRLVTVRLDCDLADHVSGWPNLDALALRAADLPALHGFYARYGFKTWLREVDAALKPAAPPPAAASAASFSAAALASAAASAAAAFSAFSA